MDVPSEPLPLEDECFFISPIGADGSDIRRRSDGIKRFVVEPAVELLGLTALRADEIGEPGQITLQIIQHVLGAKAAVVDLTGSNPNVYYELAIRHTARLPTVLIAEDGENLPFDIAQMRTIFFTHTDLNSAADCRDRITEQLRGALGGAVDSPIATAADVGSLEQGSRVERTLADLVTTVEDLAREVTRRGRRGSGEVVPEAAADLMACFRLLHAEARRLKDPRLAHLVGELREPVEYIAEQILESPSLVQRSELRFEEQLEEIEAFEEASSGPTATPGRRTPVRKKRPKPATTSAKSGPSGRSTRKRTSG